MGDSATIPDTPASDRLHSVTLRPENPADQPFLLQLYASTRAEEMKLVPWDAAQKEAFLRTQFQLQALHYHKHYPDAGYSVILLEGRPIGRLYLDRGPEKFELLDIALVPQHRGAGIGTALMRQVITEAASARKPLYIYVERDNPALRLYERLGFRLINEVGIHFFMEWLPAALSAE